MNSVTLTGSGAATTLTPGPYQGLLIQSVVLDIPLDEVGTTDPAVTLSGSVSGVYSFHGSVSPCIRYSVNETVAVSTANFTSEYSAIVKYIVYGDGKAYYNDINKSQLPIPKRLKRNPRTGS